MHADLTGECAMRVTGLTHRSESLFVVSVLGLVSALLYLPFVNQFGYFNDDWYLMYAGGAQGPAVFRDIFSIDRPLRALVMIPAYALFGPEPIYYNLAAFLFRLVSALAFLWILRLLWPRQHGDTLWVALLFLAYPGFLSQPNAIDYLCHISGLAAGLLSIALTITAIQSGSWRPALPHFVASVILGWFYLGQIEWYIGLEFFRFATIWLLAGPTDGPLRDRIMRFFRWASPFVPIGGVFLAWRLFYFESLRGATNLESQLRLDAFLASPIAFFSQWISTLVDDAVDVLFRAWLKPLLQIGKAMDVEHWLAGMVVAVLVLTASLVALGRASATLEEGRGRKSKWRWQAIGVGLGLVVFGLLPVVLVGRAVDFKSYSRYTLVASLGASLLWTAGLSWLPSAKLRSSCLGLLILSASLTHYANGLAHARETEDVRDFWWQVSWRIPQMDVGTTLVAHYFVVAEEDYFIWGPANLIYYPESTHDDYVQPGIYAALLNQETIEKVLAQNPQEFSNRRGIRTYPNYRNILVITQPTSDSCVQVIDGSQVELSSAEDPRLGQIAAFSEAHHIFLTETFRTPPRIPFGSEPSHGWCYFYEKGSFFRQLGDWAEVARLGDQALSLGYAAKDSIEWMPFLQAYLHLANTARLNELSSFVIADPGAARQACALLMTMSAGPGALEQVDSLYCQAVK